MKNKPSEHERKPFTGIWKSLKVPTQKKKKNEQEQREIGRNPLPMNFNQVLHRLDKKDQFLDEMNEICNFEFLDTPEFSKPKTSKNETECCVERETEDKFVNRKITSSVRISRLKIRQLKRQIARAIKNGEKVNIKQKRLVCLQRQLKMVQYMNTARRPVKPMPKLKRRLHRKNENSQSNNCSSKNKEKANKSIA